VNSISLWLKTSRACWISAVTDVRHERKEVVLNFWVKIDSNHGTRFSRGWREGQHDDLVLSMSLADWWGEKRPETTTLNLSTTPIHQRPPAADGDGFRCGYYG